MIKVFAKDLKPGDWIVREEGRIDYIVNIDIVKWLTCLELYYENISGDITARLNLVETEPQDIISLLDEKEIQLFIKINPTLFLLEKAFNDYTSDYQYFVPKDKIRTFYNAHIVEVIKLIPFQSEGRKFIQFNDDGQIINSDTSSLHITGNIPIQEDWVGNDSDRWIKHPHQENENDALELAEYEGMIAAEVAVNNPVIPCTEEELKEDHWSITRQICGG